MGSVLQLTKSRGNVLDMKMLFLDTVVMPVLSQMIRGREILVSACCCCLLNTPGFSHQNLRGDTRRLCTQAVLGREGVRWLQPPLDVRGPPQTPAPQPRGSGPSGSPGAFTRVMPSHSAEDELPSAPALPPPRRPPRPHSRCTGSWAHTHSWSPVPRPGGMSMGVQRTSQWVYNGSTQRGTPFSSFPKGAVWAR